jgi:hypothetical protein
MPKWPENATDRAFSSYGMSFETQELIVLVS